MQKPTFNQKNPCVCAAGSRLRADHAEREDRILDGDLLITEKVTLKGRIVKGNVTIAASAAGTAIRDCTVEGDITVLADDVQVMFCTVLGTVMLGAAVNQIVALCVAKDIVLDGAKNSVVLKNRAEDITAKNGHAVYVIENVTDNLTLTDNNYLIADCNAAENTVANALLSPTPCRSRL